MKAIIALCKAENLLFFDFNLHGENSAVYDPFYHVVSGTFKAKITILYGIKQQLNPMVPVKIVHSGSNFFQVKFVYLTSYVNNVPIMKIGKIK